MSDELEPNDSQTPPADREVLVLLKRMQQQLVFLEKKVDMLVTQSQSQPARERTAPEYPRRERSFDRPERSASSSRYQPRQERGEYKGKSEGERSFSRERGEERGAGEGKYNYSHERFLAKRQGEAGHVGSGPTKKPFYAGRPSGPTQKPYTEGRGGAGPKKRPFFKRKER